MIIDLHIHTSRYSSCSRLDPDELMVAAREKGLDGVCLTEHQVVWPREEAEELAARHNLKVFRGVEVTTTAGDVLVFGLEESVQGVPTPEELSALVEAAGGIMILAHPFRGFLVFGFSELSMSVDQAAALPVMSLVQGLEVCNIRVTDQENDFARAVAQRLGLLQTGGSDAHSAEEVGACLTVFDEDLADEAALVEALKAGRFRLERRAD